MVHSIDAHGPRMLWEGVGVGFQHWPGITVEEWVWFVGSAATCAAIFTFLQQYNKRFRMTVEQQSRVISTIHAIVATVGAVINLIDAWKHLFLPDTFMWLKSPTYGRRLVAISSGYLYFDVFILVHLWRDGAPDPFIFAHHILLLAGNMVGLATGYGAGYQSTVLFNEASTPFVNVHVGMKPQGLVRVVNGILLWLSYFFCRMLFNAFMTYSMYHTLCDDVWRREGIQTMLQLSMFAALQVLNIRWFNAITRGMIKALTAASAEAPKDAEPKLPNSNNSSVPQQEISSLSESNGTARKRTVQRNLGTVSHSDATVTANK